MPGQKIQTVLGHRIPAPRITRAGLLLVFVALLVPVLVVTGLADLAMQLLFGVCTGVWCLAGG